MPCLMDLLMDSADSTMECGTRKELFGVRSLCLLDRRSGENALLGKEDKLLRSTRPVAIVSVCGVPQSGFGEKIPRINAAKSWLNLFHHDSRSIE
jgi:hypothetical protein